MSEARAPGLAKPRRRHEKTTMKELAAIAGISEVQLRTTVHLLFRMLADDVEEGRL